MKKFIFYILTLFTAGFLNLAIADEVVVKYGVPIKVENDTYTVVDPDYYYYSGHRCYAKERPEIGINFLGLKAGIGGGTTIYCYPYP